MTNCVSNKIVLVPGCLLCPVYQVKYDEEKIHWRNEILLSLSNAGVGIIQMPCAEVLFGGIENGLSRKPHGIRYYENIPGFKQHCAELANETAQQIISLSNKGFHIKAILGIENSPTCAVNRIFTYGVGSERRQGLYIGELNRILKEKSMEIPFIGITRHKKNQNKEIDMLLKLLES